MRSKSIIFARLIPTCNQYLITLLLCLLLCATMAYAADQSIEFAFAPSPQALQLVERSIQKSEQNIEVAAYSFTSYRIAGTLIEAQKRGVSVRVLLDKGQSRKDYRIIKRLQKAGIPIRTNHRYAMMHDKYMIIDGKTVETGSFNFTQNAERHTAENVVVIENNEAIAAGYIKDWQRLWNEGSGI